MSTFFQANKVRNTYFFISMQTNETNQKCKWEKLTLFP